MARELTVDWDGSNLTRIKKQKGEAFNVLDYGAVGDNTTNDRTSIQAALDAASSAGGHVVLPGLPFLVSTPLTLPENVRIIGAHREETMIRGTAGVFTWSSPVRRVEISNMTLQGGTDHVLTGTDFVTRTHIHDCNLYVTATGKSILHLSGDDWIGNVIENCTLDKPSGSTVPAVNLISSTAGTNSNIFRNLWCYGNGSTAATFFYLESTASGNYVYDNVFEDLVMENCRGGAIEAYSVNGLVLRRIAHWDASGNYARDLIKVGQSSAGGSVDSRGVLVEHCTRRGGTLDGGKYDVNLVPGEVTHSVVTMPSHTSAPTMNLATDTLVFQGGSTGMINIGSDTYLYRNGANILRTDGEFRANGTIWADYDTAGPGIGPVGPSGESGMVMGSGADVILYRTSGGFMGTNVPLALDSETSDPGSPVDGLVWYRSDTDLMKLRAKGATESLAFLPKADQRTSDTGTINNTTLVAFCTVTLNPGTYFFTAMLGCVGNGTAYAPAFQLQGTAVTSAYRFNCASSIIGTGINFSGTTLVGSTSGQTLPSVTTTTNEIHYQVSGSFTVTTAGTVSVAMSRASGTGTFVGKAGSTFITHRTA